MKSESNPMPAQDPAASVAVLNPYTLGLHQVVPELTSLRTGGIYWVAVDRAADADTLCLQVLSAMDGTDRAALITAARSPRELVRALPADTGPDDLRLLALDTRNAARALAALPLDLERAIRPRRRLLVLLAACADWQSQNNITLEKWLTRWLPWLNERRCTLLVLSHGDTGPALAARLLPLNTSLSGLARLHRQHGQVRWLTQYWRNALGVSGAQDLMLAEDAHGFSLQKSAPVLPHQGNDEGLYLAQQQALEGAPVLSDRWQLAVDAGELYARALRAQSATIIFCIDDNDQLGALARMIHQLRWQRGMSLKIAVREMAASLRRNDEQALLACGANLVVPVGTSLPRFLLMLESLQGQRLQRPVVVDVEQLLRSTQSLALRGTITPEQFSEYLESVVESSLTGGPAGVLVVLEPVTGLSAAQALGQAHLRRYGDVACQTNDAVFLFLFACQPNSVDTALANVFRLPYGDLFYSHEVYVTAQQILTQGRTLRDAINAAAPQDAPADIEPATSATPRATQQSALPHPVAPTPVRRALHATGKAAAS